MRRRQEAAMAERARTELTGPVHPADKAAGGKVVSDALDEGRIVEHFDLLAILAGRPGQARAVDRRAPERMVGHIAIRPAEIDPIGVQRGATRTTGIAGGGRDE